MANPGEALAATIDAQWNVGTGGVKPSDIEYIVNTSDFEPNPLAIDAIFVFLPLRGTKERFNSKLRNATYFPRVVCQTKTDTARLEQITNEVDRIVAVGTPITGATYQDVLEVNDISDRMRGGYPFWVSELNCKIFTQFESSATQYGTATVATLETDELTVNTWLKLNGYSVFDILDEDDMASDRADALITQQSAKAYVDQANMIGIANAAYIPMNLWGADIAANMVLVGNYLTNNDATNYHNVWALPIPAVKDGLSLHMDAVLVGVRDADGANYLDQFTLVGYTDHFNIDLIHFSNINRTTADEYTYSIGDTDMSTYLSIKVRLDFIIATGGAMDISFVRMHCWYE